jgi:hypothetical protein
MSYSTCTPCHPVLVSSRINTALIRYSKSSGTRRFYKSSGTHTPSHMIPTLHVIQYSHSISLGNHNLVHPILECSRKHPVLECSKSSGTSINNNLVLEIIQNFGKFLGENRIHGFCLEPHLHVDMSGIIHPYHTCGTLDQGE